jgi:hypothetical protein
MKKKGHDPVDINSGLFKSDNPFIDTVFTYIVGDKVFIDTKKESICLTIDQAKKLTLFLHDRIVRPPVRFEIEGDDHYE